MKAFFRIILLMLVVTSCDYWYSGEFHDGLQLVSRNHNKDGYADENGKIVIRCKYDHARVFCNGYAFCMLKEKWGVIDTKGRTVIPFEYDEVKFIMDSIAVLGKGNHYGGVKVDGTIVFPFKYDYISEFSDGFAKASKQSKYGVLSTDGREVLDFKYDAVASITEGYAVCKGSQGWWIEPVDSGNKISNEEFNSVHASMVGGCAEIRPVSDGLAAYAWKRSETGWESRSSNWKWGFINTNGMVVAPIYSKVGDFHEGFAWVHEEYKGYYFIDKNGERLTIQDERLDRFGFSEVSDFSNGYAVVRFAVEEHAYKVFPDGTFEEIITEADRARERHYKKYHWITGKWRFNTPYGTAVYNFDGDGESGNFTEVAFGEYETGKYSVSGNTLSCHYGSHSTTFQVDFSSHTISSGGYKLVRLY